MDAEELRQEIEEAQKGKTETCSTTSPLVVTHAMSSQDIAKILGHERDSKWDKVDREFTKAHPDRVGKHKCQTETLSFFCGQLNSCKTCPYTDGKYCACKCHDEAAMGAERLAQMLGPAGPPLMDPAYDAKEEATEEYEDPTEADLMDALRLLDETYWFLKAAVDAELFSEPSAELAAAKLLEEIKNYTDQYTE